MNGRVYDPRIGRFLSPDPIVQAPGFSQSYNRYAYVFNSPVSYTDPSGYAGGMGGTAPGDTRPSCWDCAYTAGMSMGGGSSLANDTNYNFREAATDPFTRGNWVAINSSFNANQERRVPDGYVTVEVSGVEVGTWVTPGWVERAWRPVVQEDGFQRGFNPAKLAVGAFNAVNAVRLGFQSKLLALVSVFSFVIGQPEIGIPAAGLSIYKANSAVKASQRGGLQIGEAFAENFGDATPRNLLGVFPYGQRYDDLSEPLPHEMDILGDSSIWDMAVEIGTMF